MANTKTQKKHQGQKHPTRAPQLIPASGDNRCETVLTEGHRVVELGELVQTVSSILLEVHDPADAEAHLLEVATAIGACTGVTLVAINSVSTSASTCPAAMFASNAQAVVASACIGAVDIGFNASHVPSRFWDATHIAIGAMVSQFQYRVQAERALEAQVSFATTLRDVFETLASTRGPEVAKVLAASLDRLGRHLGAQSLAIWMQGESSGVVERIMRWNPDGPGGEETSFGRAASDSSAQNSDVAMVNVHGMTASARRQFSAGVEELHEEFVEAQRNSGDIDVPGALDGVRLWAVPMVHAFRLGALVVGFADGRDLTEWERAGLHSFVSQIPSLQARIAAEANLRTALEAAPIGVVVRDARGVVVECNTAYCDLVGLADKEKALGSVGTGDCVFVEAASDGQIPPSERSDGHLVKLQHSCGRIVWARVFSTKMTTGDHELTWTYYEDVTEERETHAVLSQRANFDQLTGLPNRHGFAEMISTPPAAEMDAPARSNAALLMIDLNEFKKVNDEHGHQVGDAVLQEASSRIQQAVRSTDRAVRYGGDEFVVLLAGPILVEHAMNVADNIHAAFVSPVGVNGLELQIGLSVGVTLVNDDLSIEFPDALARADGAMYRAKGEGPSGTAVEL